MAYIHTQLKTRFSEIYLQFTEKENHKNLLSTFEAFNFFLTFNFFLISIFQIQLCKNIFRKFCCIPKVNPASKVID